MTRFNNMSELIKNMGPDTQILDDYQPKPKKKKKPAVQVTAEEKRLAQQLFTDANDWLWVKARANIHTIAGVDYAAMVGCMVGCGYVVYQNQWDPSPSLNKPMTKTERIFLYTYLYPFLESGAYETIIEHVSIYMPGQKITPDFVAFDHDGLAYHYEVKGKYALGSESRASVKYRWLRYYLDIISSPHLVYWAKMGKDGSFSVRQTSIQPERDPLLSPVKGR